MGLIDRLFKRKQEEKTCNNEDLKKKEQVKELTFYEKYPDGLPLEVLELIDFKHFGAKLKQEQLLPPSYDRKPVKVEIGDFCGIPRVILTFKSKTSERYRLVGIFKYSVSYSVSMNKPIKVLEVNPLMIGVWCNFAQNVMWAWERGYNYALYNIEQRIEVYRMPKVDDATIEILKISEQNKKNFDNYKRL